MAHVRLVVSFDAVPGKGAEFAKIFAERCKESRKDAGCLQFEMFQSVDNPDKFTLLELWESQEALDAHIQLLETRPPLPPGLRAGVGQREDYTYNRIR
jgi:quinol monooxygenase YgiN